jgi:hypothetical protein
MEDLLTLVLVIITFAAFWAFLFSRGDGIPNAPGDGKFTDYFRKLFPWFTLFVIVAIVISLAIPD